MKPKSFALVALSLLIPVASIIAFAVTVGAAQTGDHSSPNPPSSQSFTYQGELLDSDVPKNGQCDLRFGLWNTPALGTQVGMTQTLSNVPINNGRFTVLLNDAGQIFSQPFNGSPRFLGIAVDCPSGTGSYTALTPRQPLTPAPYAHYAMNAGSVTWNGIAGKPDGFVDDIDNDTLYEAGTGLDLVTPTFQLEDTFQLPQSCSTDQLVEWDGAAWGCITPASGGPSYANVVVVAKSGGDYDTVQGALDSIGDASTDNRYLVWVAPGVYSETVSMKSYVDIEGAGQNLTRITSVGFTSNDPATVYAAEHSHLRFLTVENTGGEYYAKAIHSSRDDFNIQGVTVNVSGGTGSNRGIWVGSGGILNRFEDSTININANGSTASHGVYFHALTGRCELVLDHVVIKISNTANSHIYGLSQAINTGRTSVVTATHTVITLNNSGNNLGSYADGVSVSGPGGTLTLDNSSVYAYSLHDLGDAVFGSQGSTVIVRNSHIEGTTNGILASSSTSTTTVRIDHSRIAGGSYSINNLGSEVYAGATMLDGPHNVILGGILACTGSYDENYANNNGFTLCP